MTNHNLSPAAYPREHYCAQVCHTSHGETCTKADCRLRASKLQMHLRPVHIKRARTATAEKSNYTTSAIGINPATKALLNFDFCTLLHSLGNSFVGPDCEILPLQDSYLFTLKPWLLHCVLCFKLAFKSLVEWTFYEELTHICWHTKRKLAMMFSCLSLKTQPKIIYNALNLL